MDLSFLNFKRILVPLNTKDMRENLLQMMREQEIDVNMKFVDSYLDAAKLINENPFEPYDHVVLNMSVKNTKLKDFFDFLGPQIEENPKYVLEYTKDKKLGFLG